MIIKRTDTKEDFLMQVQARRAQAVKKPQKTPKKLPVWLFPLPVEREYEKELVSYVNQMGGVVNTVLTESAIQVLINERNAFIPQRTDDWADNAERLMDTVNIGFGSIPFDKPGTAADVANKTNVWNDRQWQKMLKSSFGVDIFQREPWLNQELNGFVKENVGLINKMEEDYLKDIEGTVLRGIKQGQSANTIRKEIEERTNVTRSRAKRIARDQIGKLNGQLTELRQENIGVTEYIWRDSDDVRVRPNHKSKDGKTFKWDKPPADTGHPGQDYQCRCYAEPKFEELLKDIGIEKAPAIAKPVESKHFSLIGRKEIVKQVQQQNTHQPNAADVLSSLSILRGAGRAGVIGRGKKITGVTSLNKGKKTFNLKKFANVSKKKSTGMFAVESTLSEALKNKLGVKFNKGSKIGKSLKSLKVPRDISSSDVKSMLLSVRKSIKAQRISRKNITVRMIGPKKVPKKPISAKPIKVNKEVEAKIRNTEETIRFEPFENGAVFNKNGKLLQRFSGDEDSIRIPKKHTHLLKDNILTHNHSNSTSFSSSDIIASSKYNVEELRATSPKYLYRVQRPQGKKTWGDNLKPTTLKINAVTKEWEDVFNEKQASIIKNALSSKSKKPSNISASDWVIEEATHATNKTLSKKYGFSYSRELIKDKSFIVKPIIKKKTVGEIRKEAENFFDDLENNSPKEYEALRRYTFRMHEPINDFLSKRKITGPESILAKEYIPLIDKVFKKKYAKFEGTTHRGVGFKLLDTFEAFEEQFEKGATIRLPEFISASRNKGTAEFFADKEFKAIMQIKGKNGLFIDDVLTGSDEGEILYNRNTKYKVTNVITGIGNDEKLTTWIDLEEL